MAGSGRAANAREMISSRATDNDDADDARCRLATQLAAGQDAD